MAPAPGEPTQEDLRIVQGGTGVPPMYDRSNRAAVNAGVVFEREPVTGFSECGHVGGAAVKPPTPEKTDTRKSIARCPNLTAGQGGPQETPY